MQATSQGRKRSSQPCQVACKGTLFIMASLRNPCPVPDTSRIAGNREGLGVLGEGGGAEDPSLEHWG